MGKGIPHVLRENMVVNVLLPTLYKPDVGGPRITGTIVVEKSRCRILTYML